MKKLAMLLLAIAATVLPADMASARGGRGGGRGGGIGNSGRGSGAGKTGRNRGNKKDKKSRALMRERGLAENKDAIKRDARVDSV